MVAKALFGVKHTNRLRLINTEKYSSRHLNIPMEYLQPECCIKESESTTELDEVDGLFIPSCSKQQKRKPK